MTASRRLAAILATDVAGYSRLIDADEGDTLTRLKAIRAELIDPTIAAHNGRLVKTTGDALLVEFGSVVEVLRWGLVPYWAKDLKVGVASINAKAEGIENRPAFREAFQRRRWVVERTFSWFGRNRRLAKDFENLAETLATWVPSPLSSLPSGGSPGRRSRRGTPWRRSANRIVKGPSPGRPATSEMRRKRPFPRSAIELVKPTGCGLLVTPHLAASGWPLPFPSRQP